MPLRYRCLLRFPPAVVWHLVVEPSPRGFFPTSFSELFSRGLLQPRSRSSSPESFCHFAIGVCFVSLLGSSGTSLWTCPPGGLLAFLRRRSSHAFLRHYVGCPMCAALSCIPLLSSCVPCLTCPLASSCAPWLLLSSGVLFCFCCGVSLLGSTACCKRCCRMQAKGESH